MLTKRVKSLNESITIAITTKAKNLKAAGKDVIGFSAGEPDFDTPQKIKDAAIKALQDGFTKYTAVEGTLEVRKAIADKLKRENGLVYTPDEIIVNVGAKHSLFNLFSSVVDKGDEVIIPSPYWVTYPELVTYCGGKPKFIKTSAKTKLKITPEQLKKAITSRTKMVVFTSPSNPTGAVYSKEEIIALAEVLKGTNILVASDEMYEKLVYDVEFTSFASVSEDMYKRTITINGLSKSVAMTGWRFGYSASKIKELNDAMKALQSQSTSNINSITQAAAITALDGSVDADIEAMRVQFQKRRDLGVKMFNKIKGLSVLKPQGAFYLYVNHSRVEKDSMKFASELLESVGVAVVPGAGFGMDGYFRFSFATDEKSIIEGINRIEKFVSKA